MNDKTKVIFDIKDNGEVYFDCLNHASDHDVCTIVTTLCDVLVAEALMLNHEPDKYEKGHINIYLPATERHHREVFKAVKMVFEHIEDEHPGQVKVY